MIPYYLDDLREGMILRVVKNHKDLKAGDIIQIIDLDEELDSDSEFEMNWKWLRSKNKECMGKYDYGYFRDNDGECSTKEYIKNEFEILE